ncbi:MAG TPA: glycoside hydrolase 43 family protein [Phycisphaerae bacterium]
MLPPIPADTTKVPYPAYYNIVFSDEGPDPHNSAALLPPHEPCRHPWIPDQSDVASGTYRNPIICADYSDPDICRAGDDFFMTASSFSCVPGLPILHSKDLVNWTLIGHAFHRYPNPDFNIPRHGCGIWAPAIRFHNDEFYIVVGDPDNGIFMTKTRDPFKNAWEPMHLMRQSKGWIDTAPFWDDDGQAYLIHAFSRSRAGFRNVLHIHKMSPDARSLLDDGVQVFDARGVPGAMQPIYTVIEGPKLYKRNGFYYIFAPAGGVSTGYQVVLRSKHIYGPYEHRIVLDRGTTPVNGPHQGAWINTAGSGGEEGEDWFIHFQEILPYGRVTHLQPMGWQNDWPIIGLSATDPTRGHPVLQHRKPTISKLATGNLKLVPQTDDHFDSPTLAPQWQFWANYEPSWFSLTARPGHLRLFPVPLNPDPLFYNRPNLLCQKFPAEIFTATAKVDFSNLAPYESAGIILAGKTAAALSALRTQHSELLLTRTNYNLLDPDSTTDAPQATVTLPITILYLRLRCQAGGICTLSYSTDNQIFTPLGTPVQASNAMWIGAKVGLFCNAPAQTAPQGYADFDYLVFEP